MAKPVARRAISLGGRGPGGQEKVHQGEEAAETCGSQSSCKEESIGSQASNEVGVRAMITGDSTLSA